MFIVVEFNMEKRQLIKTLVTIKSNLNKYSDAYN